MCSVVSKDHVGRGDKVKRIFLFASLVVLVQLKAQNTTGNGGNDLLLLSSLNAVYDQPAADDAWDRTLHLTKDNIRYHADPEKRLAECQRFYEYFFSIVPYLYTSRFLGSNGINNLNRLFDERDLAKQDYYRALLSSDLGYLCHEDRFKIGEIKNKWHSFLAANFPQENLVVLDPRLMERLHYSSALCKASPYVEREICLIAGLKALVFHEVVSILDKNNYYEASNRYVVSRSIFSGFYKNLIF